MSLKILYLSVNSSFSHSSPVYGQLRAFSDKYCSHIDIQWTCVNTTINHAFDSAIEEINNRKPDLLLSTAYIFNVDTLKHILSRAKALFDDEVTIVLGGPEFLGNNSFFLQSNRFIDAVFRSDESAIAPFLNAFYDKNSWHNIKGINFIDSNGDYVDNGSSFFTEPLDALPSAYAAGYFSDDKPFIHFETSRGCPSKCSFCSSAETAPKFYSIARVMNDLNIIKNAGINEIRLLDRTFNFPSERAVKLLDIFISSFPYIKFHLEIDPLKITDAFVDALKPAPKDMFHLEAGVQTFSKLSLKSVNRSQDKEAVIENLIKLCSLENIRVHTDLIAALPFQNFSDVIDDINSLAKIKPEEIQLETLKILPGSLLSRNLPDSISFSPMPPYEVLRTPEFSPRDLTRIKTISKIIDACYNEKRLNTLFRFALETDKEFITSFSSLYSDDFNFKEKPSIQRRLALFADYASRFKNIPLRDMVTLSSLIAGIIPKDDSVKILKNNFKETAKKLLVWQNSREPSSQYAVASNFESDPMEYFLNGIIPENNMPSSYIFNYPTLSFSKTISHIEKLIHIN